MKARLYRTSATLPGVPANRPCRPSRPSRRPDLQSYSGTGPHAGFTSRIAEDGVTEIRVPTPPPVMSMAEFREQTGRA